MCQVTPRKSQLERRLDAAKTFLGDRYTLAKPQKRLTPALNTRQLSRRWYDMKRTARGV